MQVLRMRGYFGIGVEGISKQMNVGSLFRTAHAFGASFLFTIGAAYSVTRGRRSDTSDAPANIPLYSYEDTAALALPRECTLVGVELNDDAIALPSFRHPRCAAYVLGRERGSLSPQLIELCDELIKIPTNFSINLAIAGALVMYDRLLSTGKFAERPVAHGGRVEPPPPHVFGDPVQRHRKKLGGA